MKAGSPLCVQYGYYSPLQCVLLHVQHKMFTNVEWFIDFTQKAINHWNGCSVQRLRLITRFIWEMLNRLTETITTGPLSTQYVNRYFFLTQFIECLSPWCEYYKSTDDRKQVILILYATCLKWIVNQLN